MKVLFCAAEALPFMATGGLADVAGSLPHALRDNSISAKIVMPLYDTIKQEWKDKMTFVTSFSVPVAWRKQYCGVFEAKVGKVTYYFIDNQYYFKRDTIYGHFDDAERFAFFSRAILEMLPHIDFKPDIIHTNDWQTALVPIYYDMIYSGYEWYKGIKNLFTIHNIQYQGQYGLEVTEEVLGIPWDKSYIVEWGSSVNLLKGAIETANWVSTVSPTYSQEILDPWFSHGLDAILRERSWKVSGILNGIDYVNYDPSKDKDIYVKYTSKSLKNKSKNKLKLQEDLGLEINAELPMVGMVTRLVSHKGLDLIKQAVDNVMQYTNCQFVVLGSGDYEYECFFEEMQAKYPGRFSLTKGFIPALSRKIYAGADIFLMPSKSEPCGLSQMISLRYGTIPLVRETGGLKDSITDSRDGMGNGFTFKSYSSGDMLTSLHAAIATYNADKDYWKKLVLRAMACDNSWSKSALEYIDLYKSL